MRWRAKALQRVGEYSHHFAFLPICIPGGEDESVWIWLERYEQLLRQHPTTRTWTLSDEVQERLKGPNRRVGWSSGSP